MHLFVSPQIPFPKKRFLTKRATKKPFSFFVMSPVVTSQNIFGLKTASAFVANVWLFFVMNGGRVCLKVDSFSEGRGAFVAIELSPTAMNCFFVMAHGTGLTESLAAYRTA